MREIKLSLKDAREREERNRGENSTDWWEKCHHSHDNFGATYDVHPPHKPGWHRAPDLAMLKSRPVDPPRKRDIEALRRAAFEPGSTPEKPIPKRGRTDDDCLREKFSDEISCAKCGTVVHEGEPIHSCPAPAPVADSAVGEFEPVGTQAWAGDRMKRPGGYEYSVQQIDVAQKAIRFTDGSYITFEDYANAKEMWRILKRKNVAARAWKYPLNGQICLLIGDHGYTKSGKIGRWAGAGTRGPCQGNHGEEIHDPAEIQRLVAELHAAGLGEIKITPVL